MVVHACNPSVKDAETGACYKFQVSLGYKMNAFLKKNNKNEIVLRLYD